MHPSVEATWLVLDGWPNETMLGLRRLPNPEAYTGEGQSLTFHSDGSVSLQQHVPQGRRLCGNGMPYLDQQKSSFAYNPKKQDFAMHLKGGRLMLDGFEYKIDYQVVAHTPDLLILRQEKVHIAENELPARPIATPGDETAVIP